MRCRSTSYAARVGRVGALAVALGIGSAIAAIPHALADTTGSSGAPGASASGSTSGDARTAGVNKAAKSPAPPSAASAGKLLSSSSFDDYDRDQEVPAAVPVMLSAAGLTRHDVGGGASNGPKFPDSSIADLIGSDTESPSDRTLFDPNAGKGNAPRSVLSNIVNHYFGNGTAEHPDGGILLGNGYSWTYETCTTVCDGGNGGIFGSGGNGFNGGNGGSAGWFGHGGAGGDALIAGGRGGDGGRGGVLTGDGGAGGAGAVAVDTVQVGGRGGHGGNSGYFGKGGAGGRGGDAMAIGNDLARSGIGGAGGDGGNGGLLSGDGGRGGDGGSANFADTAVGGVGGNGGNTTRGTGGTGGNGGLGAVSATDGKATGGNGGQGGTGLGPECAGGQGGDGGDAAATELVNATGGNSGPGGQTPQTGNAPGQPGATGTAIDAVAIPLLWGTPRSIAISSDGRSAYVPVYDPHSLGTLTWISLDTNKIVGDISLGGSPKDVAVGSGDLVYVANDDGYVSVVDLGYRVVRKKLDVGLDHIHNIVVNARTFDLYVNGLEPPPGYYIKGHPFQYSDGRIKLFDQETGNIAGSKIIGDDPRGILTSRFYFTWALSNVDVNSKISNRYGGWISVFTRDFQFGYEPIRVGRTAVDIVGDSDTPERDRQYVYVTNTVENRVVVFDYWKRQYAAEIPVENQPWAMAISPDDKYVYVTTGVGFRHQGQVAVIDTATRTVVKTIDVGDQPRDIAITPDGKWLYVTSESTNSVFMVST